MNCAVRNIVTSNEAHYLCGCGHTFEQHLGGYGCPNCKGKFRAKLTMPRDWEGSPRRDGETDQQLARRLGIQPCHVHANELVDLAEKKDREAYRRRLDELEQDYGIRYRDLVNDHAKRQIRMAQHDHRMNPWRSVWMENAKGQR